MAKSIDIQKGWVAFIKDDNTCVGYREFPKGGKYFGTLELIIKTTESELKAELKVRKIALPK